MPSNWSAPTRHTTALVRSLLHKKSVRDGEAAFVLEGPKVIGELLISSPSAIRLILATPEWVDSQGQDLLSSVPATRLFLCSKTILQKLTDTSTTQDVLAVVERPVWNESAIFSKPAILAVYGETLQDPTNVGTLIRSAAAFGANAVCLSPGCADPFSPKVLRATAGTVLKLPVLPGTTLADIQRYRCRVYAGDSDRKEGVSLATIVTRPSRLILAFGNESRGLTDDLRHLSTVRFYIATREEVESLNVASSAGIALFHFNSLPVDSN